jgi:hypothetical protein
MIALPAVVLPTEDVCSVDQVPLVASESTVHVSSVPASWQPTPMTTSPTVIVPVVTVGTLLEEPVPTPPVL